MKPLHLFVCLFALTAGSAVAQLTSTPSNVVMSAQLNGSAVTQTISLSGSAASFIIVQSPVTSWLQVAPTTGTAPVTVTLTAIPAGLPVGSYSTTLQLYAGSATPLLVPVTLTISSIGVDPGSLAFAYATGGTLPPAQTITITGAASSTFTASVATGSTWLQAVPNSGTIPGAITVFLNSAVVPTLTNGVYNGSIEITPTQPAGAAPVTVPVTLTVGAPMQANLSALALTFGYQTAAANNVTSKTVTLSTNTTTNLTYFLQVSVDPNPAGAQWLSVSPTGGTFSLPNPAVLTVTVTPGSLPQGTYRGRIVVTAYSATPATQEIAVTLNVSSLPLLNVPATALIFNHQVGSAPPAPQSVTPTSTSTPLTYTVAASTANGVPWLSVSPVSGTTPSPFQVSVNPAALSAGIYSGTVTVTGIGSANGAQQIPVSLTVGNDASIAASASSLTFLYQVGVSPPGVQSVRVSSTTGAPLVYSVSALPSWLVLGGQTSGTTEGVFTVFANVAGQPAGTYDGTVSITAVNASTGVAAPNSPLSIPVKAYVSTTPLLLASPSSVSLTAQVGGNAPPFQSITLTSSNPNEQINYKAEFTADSGGSWLSFAGLQTGTTPATISVSAATTLLSAGTYTGRVTVTATTAAGAAIANSPVVIPVTLTMSQGTLIVTPTSLTFPAQAVGSTPPTPQTLNVQIANGPATAFSALASGGGLLVTWISVTPISGTTPGTVSVSIDPSRLTPGTYQGQVTISAAGVSGSPITVPVSYTVAAGTIAATPSSLSFQAVQSAAAPAAQTINVTNSGGGTLTYTAGSSTTSGGSWLIATGTAGTTPGQISVSVNHAGLAPGTYNGSITVTSQGASGSPLTIPVSLTVTAAQTMSAAPASLAFSYTTGLAVPAAQTVQVTASGSGLSVTTAAQTATGSGWLSVTPASGSTPLTLSVSVSPQNLAAGTYNGSIVVSSPNASASLTIPVTITVVAIPPPAATAIVNSASFAAGALSPGEIVTLGGTGMANAGDSLGLTLDASGGVATKLGDTRVLFDNVPAPLIYVSPTQINAVVPYQVAGRVSTRVQVEYKGILGPSIEMQVVDAAPAIFTQNQSGAGPGAILNQNGSTNTSNNPAAKLSVVAVYATGEGQTSPAGVTGQVIPSNGSGLKTPVLRVTATIGGRPARVVYSGSAPGAVSGAFQVNVEVPEDAPSGLQQISIVVGTRNTQSGVTVAVQ